MLSVSDTDRSRPGAPIGVRGSDRQAFLSFAAQQHQCLLSARRWLACACASSLPGSARSGGLRSMSALSRRSAILEFGPLILSRFQPE
jgi:hypothetical protein